MTLNFRYGSGYDTTELLKKGKGNSVIVSNRPFLVSVCKISPSHSEQKNTQLEFFWKLVKD